MTDTKLLKQKIDESGYRFSWIAKQLNLSPYGLRKKVDGENEFKATEIMKFQEILKISNDERDKIFLSNLLKKWQHFKRDGMQKWYLV